MPHQEQHTLGRGFRGKMPKPIIVHNNSSSFSRNRLLLRNAWNTTTYSGDDGEIIKGSVTPFRGVNNAGDVLGRVNYSCGGTCQTYQSRPQIKGLKGRFGAIQSQCDETLIPPSACNVKYVYDSSDYVTYLKRRAINRNYNDKSFGGDESSASQSALRAIRRF